MSSSEVQRTLVKSPPELWAELGDPAALARHLGGLGDIRITRVDPEQSVEWETEEASGTVLIKPSGWGTKVTLTVTRKTPEPTASPGVEADGTEDAHAEAVAEADHAGEDESAVAAERTVDGESPLLAERPAEAESTVGAEQPARAESAVTVHRAVEAEPPVEAAPAPQAEPEPTAHAESERPVAPVAIETMGQTDAEGAPAEHSESGPELVPRRGFFARLFGRRPRRDTVEPEPSELTVAAVWQPGAVDGTLAAKPQPDPAVTIGAAEPQPDPPGMIVAGEHHSDPAVTIGAAEVPPASPASPEPDQPGEPDGVIVAEEPHAEPLAAAADENAADELDGPRESAGESPDHGPSEPAAVPQTPEQDASAEVTEVLTAVLDRLGAAHHRPFSRG